MKTNWRVTIVKGRGNDLQLQIITIRTYTVEDALMELRNNRKEFNEWRVYSIAPDLSY